MNSEATKNIGVFALGFIIAATLVWVLQNNLKHYLLHVPKQQAAALFLEDEVAVDDSLPHATISSTSDTLNPSTGCGCPDCCSVLMQ